MLKNKQILCIAGLLFLVGCSNNKTASEENFIKLINDYMLTSGGCSAFREIGLAEVEIKTSGWLVPKEGERFKEITDNSRIFDIFVEDGLYTVQKKSAKGNFGSVEASSIYSLTENGKKTFNTDGTRQACSTFYKIDKFNNFSDPSKSHTYAYFTLKFKSDADWVNSVQKRKPDFFIRTKLDLEKSYPYRATLSLMSDGWMVNGITKN